jgi:hypothetical protein
MGGVHDAYTGNTEFKKMVPLQIEAFRQVGPDRLHLQFGGGDDSYPHDAKVCFFHFQVKDGPHF